MMKVIVIAGATGVGKTELSIKLAKMFNGEIVNADASQFRRNLNIGTAKIKEEEKEGVNHHLFDILDETCNFSIRDYQTIARAKIDQISKNNKLPFIVGGSGLYIDALINDYDLSGPSNDYLESEKEYETYSNEELFALLKSIDEDFASHTHPNNRKRVIRYIQKAKEGLSFENEKPKKYYDALFLFLNRERDDLYDRINRRTIQMMEDGWIEEVKSLIDNRVDIDKIKEIGYKEIRNYLNNLISYDEMIDLIQKQTRHYAKRQITWFKNKSDSIIIDANNINYEFIYDLINEFLKS